MKRLALFSLLFILIFPARLGAQTDVSGTNGGFAGALTALLADTSPTIWTEPTTGIQFVYIPGGCYDMGSDSDVAYEVEQPVHRVCVSSFWMSRFEVTNEQFLKYDSTHDSGTYQFFSLTGDSYPVVRVGWTDADDFATWLTNQGNGTFRLPTEAEWEFAARAGTTTKWYWGDDDSIACQYANVRYYYTDDYFHCKDGYDYTSPVGSFTPNDYGLYDMIANAGEWTLDVWDPDAYDNHSLYNPVTTTGPSPDYHTIRGGTWLSMIIGTRSAYRGGLADGLLTPDLGFRLVKTD